MSNILEPSAHAKDTLKVNVSKEYELRQHNQEQQRIAELQKRYAQDVLRAAKLTRSQSAESKTDTSHVFRTSRWLSLSPGANTQYRLHSINVIEKRLMGIPIRTSVRDVHLYIRPYDYTTKTAGESDFPVLFTMDHKGVPAILKSADKSDDLNETWTALTPDDQDYHEIDRLLTHLETKTTYVDPVIRSSVT